MNSLLLSPDLQDQAFFLPRVMAGRDRVFEPSLWRQWR
jgi:hypothetical protein